MAIHARNLNTKRARSESTSSLSSVPLSDVEPTPLKKRKSARTSQSKRKAKTEPSTPPSQMKLDPDALLPAPLPPTPTSADKQRTKKLSILSEFSTISPFPTYLHPTPSEAEQIYQLLAAAHPGKAHVRRPVAGPSVSASKMKKNSAETCGRSPNVLDALIGTILSQNTNSRNSTGAKRSLDAAFCTDTPPSTPSSSSSSAHRMDDSKRQTEFMALDPDAKIAVDLTPDEQKYERIATAPMEEVVEAIKSGGLARRKAAIIQGLLRTVKERWGRYSLQFLLEDGDGKSTTEASGAGGETGRWTDEAIMRELVSYPGIGPKTAACVLLFCLGRDSFAVDTHVFRLSRVLGWVPRVKSVIVPVTTTSKAEDDDTLPVPISPSKRRAKTHAKVPVDRVNTQMHLDVHVPPHLKYPLHVLMITHGRSCKGCKTVNSETGRAVGKDDGCVLRGWVREREKTEKDKAGDVKEEFAEQGEDTGGEQVIV